MRACILLFLGLFLLGFPALSFAQSKELKEKACKGLFKQKRFVEAAQCFSGLADSLDAKALKVASHRYQKGRWVRNAAILLTKAAGVEKESAKKSYYYELARNHAALYLTEKLYETKHQKRLGKVRLAGLDAKIGYASLSITTKHLAAKIQLEGYKFKASGVGAWSQKVRPGNYVVKVTYPKSPVEIKAIKVTSGAPKIVAFAPPATRAIVAPRPKTPIATRKVAKKANPRIAPKPPNSAPVWPWALIFGGGAVAAAGVVIVGLGGANYSAATAMRERGLAGTATSEDTAQSFNGLHDQVDWQVPVGSSLLGVGGVALVIGIIGKATAKGPGKRASLAPAQKHKRALLHFAK